MLFRLAWKDFKRILGINLLEILLLIAVFLTAISIVSAVQIKFKKYSVLSEYLNKNGVYIESGYLAQENNGNNVLLRDEKELKEYFPEINSVLSVEQVWDMTVTERDLPVTLWCYSEAVVNAFSPSMESGRWFQKSDMDSDMLKAVITYNENDLKPGDIVTLETGMSGAKEKVEIIGVMKDNESLFYTSMTGSSYGDYRDCYYVYNYEAEGKNVLMILADQQILNGEEKGNFEVLNYRLNRTAGFQKEMTGGTLLTFDNDVSQDVIDQDVEKLKKASAIYRIYSLSQMKDNSWNYILEELHNYFPVFICIFIFVLIAAISANTITVKKQLKNYAVYNICGLPWKKCAAISLCGACITSGVAFVIVAFGVFFLKNAGSIENTALQLGWWQLLVCYMVILSYILLAWLIPLGIVRNTSAKEIIANNR